jgi:hypothetical protein
MHTPRLQHLISLANPLKTSFSNWMSPNTTSSRPIWHVALLKHARSNFLLSGRSFRPLTFALVHSFAFFSYRCRDKISWFPIYLRPGTASFVGRIPRDQHLPHLHYHHLQHLIFHKHSPVVTFRLFSDDVLTTSWTGLYFLSSHGILFSISTFNLTIFPSFPLSTHISSQSINDYTVRPLVLVSFRFPPIYCFPVLTSRLCNLSVKHSQ